MDKLELKIIRAAIAMKDLKKKDLAFSFGLAPATLSEYLHGYKSMPHELYHSLIKQLELGEIVKRAKSEQEGLDALA